VPVAEQPDRIVGADVAETSKHVRDVAGSGRYVWAGEFDGIRGNAPTPVRRVAVSQHVAELVRPGLVRMTDLAGYVAQKRYGSYAPPRPHRPLPVIKASAIAPFADHELVDIRRLCREA